MLHWSVCNPGTAAAEAEKRKSDKYIELVDDAYLSQSLAFEIQGAAGPSAMFFEQTLQNLKSKLMH